MTKINQLDKLVVSLQREIGIRSRRESQSFAVSSPGSAFDTFERGVAYTIEKINETFGTDYKTEDLMAYRKGERRPAHR